MTLDNVKLVLSITDDRQDDLLTILLTNAINTVCLYINVEQIPKQLEFVAEQMCVARYRKLGAEGITTEKIDVLSTTYQTNDLRQFKDVLNAYIENNLDGRRIKFL